MILAVLDIFILSYLGELKTTSFHTENQVPGTPTASEQPSSGSAHHKAGAGLGRKQSISQGSNKESKRASVSQGGGDNQVNTIRKIYIGTNNILTKNIHRPRKSGLVKRQHIPGRLLS